MGRRPHSNNILHFIIEYSIARQDPRHSQDHEYFSGLPTIQFLISCSMQKSRGEAWSILSHNTWGDRGGEGSSIERMSLRPYLVVSGSSAGVVNVCEAKNIPLLVQKKNACVKCILSIGDPSPPSPSAT